VEHADAMRGREPATDALGDGQAPPERKHALALLEVLERLAGDVLHRDELFAADLGQVVDAADVRVGDAAREDDLAAEGLPALGRDAVGADALERDLLVELEVARPIDDAHPAESEDGVDAIAVAQDRADVDRGLAALRPLCRSVARRQLALVGQVVDDSKPPGGPVSLTFAPRRSRLPLSVPIVRLEFRVPRTQAREDQRETASSRPGAPSASRPAGRRGGLSRLD